MKHIRAFLSTLLALLLTGSLAGAAWAHPVPDLTQTGSITVDMLYNGSPVTGGALTIYRVGDIAQENGDFTFVKTAAMKDFNGSYEDLESPELAQALAKYVKDYQVMPQAKANNVNGKAQFGGLELGLYLIVQTERSQGFQAMDPFLISLPMLVGAEGEEEYLYDVNAQGKFGLEKEPDEPKKPWKPTLPQTGQLNWPVPLLAILGLGLVSTGWVLRSRGGKSGDES